MSFRAVLWALEQLLPPTQKLVLVALASHASRDDGSCFPKIRTIAREASVSTRTIHRLLPKLEAGKLVRVERKFAGKARLPHKYWLACPIGDPRGGIRGSGSVTDRRGYDSRGGSENHYLDHNQTRQWRRNVSPTGSRHGGDRNHVTPEQAAEQKAQAELARRLGAQGWEILAAFNNEVPRLCAQLRRGTLTRAQLLDLRARFIESGGQR